MKSRLTIIALLATMACETQDPGLQFNAFKSIEDECAFQAGSNPDLLGFTFDPLLFESFTLYGELQSTLGPPTLTLDQTSGRTLEGNVSTNITEFEYVFECDISGFAGPRQLFLPGSGGDPFCRDPRDPDRAFTGLDLVPLSMTLNGREASVVATRVVSPNLSNRFVEFFDIVEAAEECCGDTPAGMPCDTTTGSMSCNTVDMAVNADQDYTLDQIPDLVPFREAVFTGPGDGDFLGPLLMNIKGNYRGITNRGSSLVSNEASFTLDVCAGCRSIPYQALVMRAASGMDSDAEAELEERNNFLSCFQ